MADVLIFIHQNPLNMMKMRIVSLAVTGVSLTLLVACNNNKDKEGTPTDAASAPTETSTPTGSGSTQAAPANASKSYTVSFAPDSAIIGKSGEAKVKMLGGTAMALTDPDGKDNGIELVLKMQATNSQKIGEGSNFGIAYSDSRLALDNGTNIPAETGTDNLRAEPESSGKIESWTYQLPAGTKPTALNLFLDGTRVSVGIMLK